MTTVPGVKLSNVNKIEAVASTGLKYGIAIGNANTKIAKAQGFVPSVAIGYNAYAVSPSSVVIGSYVGSVYLNSPSDHFRNVAIGYEVMDTPSTISSIQKITAVGNKVLRFIGGAYSQEVCAIGSSCGDYDFLGGTVSSPGYSTFVGILCQPAFYQVNGSTAVGTSAVSGTSAVAVGHYTSANATGSITLGNYSYNDHAIGFSVVFTGTGNGSIGTVSAGDGFSQRFTSYEVTMTTATAFNVVRFPGSVAVGSGTTGVLFDAGGISFTLSVGGIAFIAGDEFVCTPVEYGKRGICIGSYSHVNGDYGIIIGHSAGSSSNDATGANNIGIGRHTLDSMNNSSAINNVAIGLSAGTALTSGNNNSLIGQLAGTTLTTGANCVCLGNGADVQAAANSSVVVIGANATGGLNTVVIGVDAESLNNGSISIGRNSYTGGFFDVAIGNGANTGPYASYKYCVAIGYAAGSATMTGRENICIGYESGNTLTSGDYNICIGSGITSTVTGDTTIMIGRNVGTTTAYGNATTSGIAIGYGCLAQTNSAAIGYEVSGRGGIPNQYEFATNGMRVINRQVTTTATTAIALTFPAQTNEVQVCDAFVTEYVGAGVDAGKATTNIFRDYMSLGGTLTAGTATFKNPGGAAVSTVVLTTVGSIITLRVTPATADSRTYTLTLKLYGGLNLVA